MYNLLILAHSFGNNGDFSSFFLSAARVRSVVRPGARLADLPDMVREAKDRFPDFRPHFVVLLIGDNDVHDTHPRSLASDMAHAMYRAVRDLEAREIWTSYLFVRGQSRWTQDPTRHNARASRVNRTIHNFLRPGTHMLRHQLAASDDIEKNRERREKGLRRDGTHLNRTGVRMVADTMKVQLSKAARRHGLGGRAIDRRGGRGGSGRGGSARDPIVL